MGFPCISVTKDLSSAPFIRRQTRDSHCVLPIESPMKATRWFFNLVSMSLALNLQQRTTKQYEIKNAQPFRFACPQILRWHALGESCLPCNLAKKKKSRDYYFIAHNDLPRLHRWMVYCEMIFLVQQDLSFQMIDLYSKVITN